MAGPGNSSGTRFKYLSIRTKDKTLPDAGTPYFAQKEKVGEIYKDTNEYTNFVGKIRGIDVGEYEYENKKNKKLVLIMEADGEFWKIEGTFSNNVRGLINSLASVPDIEKDILIRLYPQKDKNGSNKIYAGNYVEQEGTGVKWKYAVGEFPKPIRETYKNVDIIDTTETDKFFVKVIEEIGARLSVNEAKASRTPEQRANEPAETHDPFNRPPLHPAESQIESDPFPEDDLPF